MKALLPPGWQRPKGYSNGMLGEGRMVTVAGMVGWDEQGRFADGFAPQVRQALLNVLAVLREADAGPETIARMTWYVTDMVAYRGAGPALTPIWRETMGRHYPAMAVVGVTALVEPHACVEIDALALLP